MCGFVGMLNLDSSRRADGIVQSLAALQVHRGPDDAGLLKSGPFALAHQRLRILDLSVNGTQPMQTKDRSHILGFAGEVYNYIEIKEKLLNKDPSIQFSSKTDTEVVLQAIKKWGHDALSELNGMFALSYFEPLTGRLTLARDPFGIKPLFYLVHNNQFWFSTEIKSLLKVPGYASNQNFEALFHYFSYNYIPGELTAFTGIKELLPGHFLTISGTDSVPKIS